MSPERIETEVEGRRLSLSNLSKVLYPEVGFTKGEVIDYYARIAEIILPHLAERPATLKRYPDGVDGESFFEKHAPRHTPEWVRRAKVPSGTSRARQHTEIEYVVIDDRPTLVWAANLAAIELHVPLWRVGDGSQIPADPDLLVFDLDPGPGTSIVECCTVASWIRDRFGGSETFAKTSGSKGLQLYRRLEKTSSEEASAIAHDVALAIERDHPELVVSKMKKDLRSGRVLIDWSQNSPSKTTVVVYSLRARTTPTVSTPVSWAEVDRCAREGDPDALRFDAKTVLARVERDGDLFAAIVSQ